MDLPTWSSQMMPAASAGILVALLPKLPVSLPIMLPLLIMILLPCRQV